VNAGSPPTSVLFSATIATYAGCPELGTVCTAIDVPPNAAAPRDETCSWCQVVVW
jgi:hypothetical protein